MWPGIRARRVRFPSASVTRCAALLTCVNAHRRGGIDSRLRSHFVSLAPAMAHSSRQMCGKVLVVINECLRLHDNAAWTGEIGALTKGHVDLTDKGPESGAWAEIAWVHRQPAATGSWPDSLATGVRVEWFWPTGPRPERATSSDLCPQALTSWARFRSSTLPTPTGPTTTWSAGRAL
jgi:hypothetical protein